MSAQEKETDVQTFNNNNLTVLVSRKPHCQVKFDIQVTQPAVEAAYQKAIKRVSKEVSVPGFRKGKAPAHFITERYASAIKEEFMDVVLQSSFNEALDLTQLMPLKDSLKSPKIKECSREKGAHFIIEFEARLTPPEVHLEQIKVKRVTPQAITEKDRDEAIQQLVLRMAEFTPITDRPVQENDFVNLQVVLFGELPKVIENHRVQVNADNLPKWLYEKVLGAQAGETFEGITEPSTENADELNADRAAPFKATVLSISEAKTPELNEEFIKKIGLESHEDLNVKMQERLEQTAFEDAFEQQTNLIERALLDTYHLDIPKSYLDAEFKVRLEEYLQPLLEQGLADYVEKNRQSIEEQIKKISIDRLSIYFLLHVVAVRNHITPTQDEINLEMMRQKYLMSIGRSQISASNKEELTDQLYNLAMEQKIKQFLLNKVTFIEE